MESLRQLTYTRINPQANASYIMNQYILQIIISNVQFHTYFIMVPYFISILIATRSTYPYAIIRICSQFNSLPKQELIKQGLWRRKLIKLTFFLLTLVHFTNLELNKSVFVKFIKQYLIFNKILFQYQIKIPKNGITYNV